MAQVFASLVHLAIQLRTQPYLPRPHTVHLPSPFTATHSALALTVHPPSAHCTHRAPCVGIAGTSTSPYLSDDFVALSASLSLVVLFVGCIVLGTATHTVHCPRRGPSLGALC